MARFYTSKAARAAGYRSGLEQKAALQLDDIGRDFKFESDGCKFDYYLPIRNGALLAGTEIKEPPKGIKIVQRHSYTCDFLLQTSTGDALFIETKGYFKPKDRTKHAALKKQFPDVDLRIIFQSNGKVSSKTKYSDWCDKQGITYHVITLKERKAGIVIPEAWLCI